MSCVELGLSGLSKWWAVKNLPSNSLKNRGATGIFAEGDVEQSKTQDSRADDKVIVLLNRRHISSLFA